MEVIDLDQDGDLDIVVANTSNQSISIFSQPPFCAFQRDDYAAPSLPQDVAVFDANGDSLLDIAVLGSEASWITLLRQSPDHTFESHSVTYTGGGSAQAFVNADFNADGIQDFAATNYTSNSLSVLLGDGTGSFNLTQVYAAGLQPLAVAAADLDNDGAIDLAVANSSTGHISLFRGFGNGTFATPIILAAGNRPADIAIFDTDRNGRQDIIVSAPGDDSLVLLKNTGVWAFTRSFIPASPDVGQIALGDVDLDSRVDIMATDFRSDSILFFHGLTNGSFALQQTMLVGSSPKDLVIVPGTTGSERDLIFVQSQAQSMALIHLEAGSIFPLNPQFRIGSQPTYLAAADINSDGFADLIAVHVNALAVLSGNASGPSRTPLWFPLSIPTGGVAARRL